MTGIIAAPGAARINASKVCASSGLPANFLILLGNSVSRARTSPRRDDDNCKIRSCIHERSVTSDAGRNLFLLRFTAGVNFSRF